VTDVVFGATACGVMAAVAARAGAETVLVEPGEHVGGRGDPIIAGGWPR
jgi:NADPH-dependent 2,4-dienoyl-CoA reductase/sulfur reductase-like enzyme